jgi:type VI secretion system VasD/TssJ family lipoprotein
MRNDYRRGIVFILPLILSVVLGCLGDRGRRSSAGSADRIYSDEIYVFAENAIKLSLQADPSLNLHSGEPHTLAVCVYQLRSPNAFNQLKDEKQGLSKLMECSRFDGSVMNAKMEFVQPGRELERELDRAEGAKYVGITAGYYRMDRDAPYADKVTRLFYIPVKKTITLSPKVRQLIVDLYLGPHGIQDTKEK